VTSLRSRDWGKTSYWIAIITLLAACVYVIFLGESFSYWLAYRYLKKNYQSRDILAGDRSADWLKPRLKGIQIVDAKHPLLLKRHFRILWILEQKGTGLQSPLPEGLLCNTEHFGLLNFFSVRRCEMRKMTGLHLHAYIKRTLIRLGKKKCKWKEKYCRFGPSWRRVNLEDGFKSRGVARTCIFAHPQRNKWLSLRFPVLPFPKGLKLVFGFRDGTGSHVPMRVKFLLKKKTLLDLTIPHKPRWHVHFWSQKQLKTQKGQLELLLWTKHEGGKAFCVDGLLLQTSKNKDKR